VLILGIETSCDETSASVVRWENDRPALASLVILSQDVHRVFGGVVPELASRAHVQAIEPVVEQALKEAGRSLDDLDGIAVTAGPGLVGALLVGVMYGKTLAFSLDCPLIGVNHLEGHLFAPTLEDPELEPPFIGLLVSGGHTMLLDVPAWGDYRLLGQTLDDAAGEAFDKVARILGLGFPGGPAVQKAADGGDAGKHPLPRAWLKDSYDFSFSGLKTAVLHLAQSFPEGEVPVADIAASFQESVADVLSTKLARAATEFDAKDVGIAGGVAANSALRRLTMERSPLPPRLPALRYCTDNASMIGSAAHYRFSAGVRSPMAGDVIPNLPIGA